MTAFQFFGYCIYGQYEEEGDDRFKHTYRRSIGEHAVLNTITERIGINNIRILSVEGVAQKEVLVKSGIQQAAYGKNQQYQNRGPEHGKQDIPDLF